MTAEGASKQFATKPLHTKNPTENKIFTFNPTNVARQQGK
jgi:hypothetical protein